MNLKLLELLPSELMFVLLPALALLALALLTGIFRFFSKQFGFDDFDAGILDTATQNAMSGAYVVLGFVLVLVMATSNEIDGNVAKEASQIERLDRLLVLEGCPAAQVARQSLQVYAKSIVSDDWRKLSQGARHSQTRNQSDALFQTIKAIEPSTSLQVALLIDIIKTNEELNQYRNIRMLGAQSSLPGLFWQLSYLTMLGVIAIAALRLLKPSGIGIAALVIQLIMISLLFATVMILDMPYIGQVKSSPEAFNLAIKLMQSR